MSKQNTLVRIKDKFKPDDFNKIGLPVYYARSHDIKLIAKFCLDNNIGFEYNPLGGLPYIVVYQSQYSSYE